MRNCLLLGDGDISILGLVSGCVTTTTQSVRQLAVYETLVATSDDSAYLVSSDLRLIVRPNGDKRVPWALDLRCSIPFQERDLSRKWQLPLE